MLYSNLQKKLIPVNVHRIQTGAISANKPKSNYLLHDGLKLYIISNHSYLYPMSKKYCTLYSTETTRLFLLILSYIMTVIAHDISTKYTNHMSTLGKGNDLLCDRTFH